MSNLYLSASFKYLVQSLIMLYKYVRDAPLDIWGGGGGGGARVFVACKLFFYLREKTIFFLAINLRQFFFMLRRRNLLLYASPNYVRYHLVFFLVNIFFINFYKKLFFLPTFSTNFFF